MAEGEEQKDNPSLNRKPATDSVWDIKLFQNMGYAANLSCIECGHPPKKCLMDKDYQTLCGPCSEPLLQQGHKINDNPVADGMIAKAEISCKNILFDPQKADDEKQEEPQQCEWKGLVKDWQNHNDKECQFTVVNCEDCCEYRASRSLIPAHHEVCPFATIQCPLKCNLEILRKDTDDHTKNDCSQTILDCTNAECPDKVIRALHHQHVTEQCPKRIVPCPYGVYGCTQPNVKHEAMEGHLGEFETKHLQFQLNSLYQLMNQKQRQQQGRVEAGMIRMFGGDMKNIPNDWLLCDGTHGTPDLRAQFVLKNSKRCYGDTDEFEISEIDEDENENDIIPCYSMIYIMKC